jgi:EAL and modified HD-GYP domain-containing signal transduction protein
MELFVARQPIFDRNLSVVAYEMLYRSGATNAYDGADPRTATAKVLNAVFYSPDGHNLLGGRPAFVNFPESMLLDGTGFLLPTNTVIEVLETVEPTPEIAECCRNLQNGNYRIALDDFAYSDQTHPLAPFATYIKVDLRATSRATCKQLVAKYGRGRTMLAEKVETEEEFRWAAANGFSLFQGYFFARPDVNSVAETPGFKLTYLEILKKICAPDLNFADLAALIERDPGLSYKLLRLANSAMFGRRHAATSINHALLRLGEDETKKWLSLIVSLDLASDRPSEVMVSALVRARFCELLAPEAGMEPPAGEYFMLGLFSRLDAMFSRPLPDILKDVPLSDRIRATLLEPEATDTTLARLWRTILAYEAADWDRVSSLLSSLKLDTERINALYADAVVWSDANLRR